MVNWTHYTFFTLNDVGNMRMWASLNNNKQFILQTIINNQSIDAGKKYSASHGSINAFKKE